MSKHTPGPWTAEQDPNSIMSDEWCIGAQGQIDMVAVCSERDARLIAAAPDLLAALKTVVANAPDPYCAITRYIDAQCRAAIAKAEGKE